MFLSSCSTQSCLSHTHSHRQGTAARGQPARLSSPGPRDTRRRQKPPGTPHHEKQGGQGKQGPSRSGTRSEGRQCAGAQDRAWGHPAAPLRPQAGGQRGQHSRLQRGDEGVGVRSLRQLAALLPAQADDVAQSLRSVGLPLERRAQLTTAGQRALPSARTSARPLARGSKCCVQSCPHV